MKLTQDYMNNNNLATVIIIAISILTHSAIIAFGNGSHLRNQSKVHFEANRKELL